MPPKEIIDISLTQAHVNVLKSTLISLESFNPNWATVRQEAGVANAPRDFKQVLKKFGLKLSNGTISEDNDNSTNAPAAPAKTSETTKNSKSTKKRTANAVGDEHGTPAKKGKTTKIKAKSGDEAKIEEGADVDINAKDEDGGDDVSQAEEED